MFVPTLLLVALVVAQPGSEPPLAETTTGILKRFRQEFVHITPGQGRFPATFTMGRAEGPTAARPPHKVTLSGAFYIARYEVPQNLWKAVTGHNPSRWKGPRNSVEMLSFDEAVAFCEKATRLLRQARLIDRDQRIRLPSEAEWEYVARAGTTTLFSFGDDPKLLDEFGWHTGNAAGNDPPVGAKRPNAWSLYDVHGYLWEWCADPWHDNYETAPDDGRVWRTVGDASRRVLRGGSWKDKPDRCTSTFRRPANRQHRDPAIGLRCVLD